MYVFSSRSHWTRQARHILSDKRVHKAGEDVGEIRRVANEPSIAIYQAVRGFRLL